MRKLTYERACEAFSYDPNAGSITWRIKVSTKVIAGRIAGGINKADGYRQIRIDDQLYRGHQIAWLLMVGTWPESLIDHINGVRSDNRWENLRSASNAINMQNRFKANVNNAAGLLGVSRKSNGQPFAQIMVAGKNIYLGSFDTPDLAHSAYLNAKKSHHPECYFDAQGQADRAKLEASA